VVFSFVASVYCIPLADEDARRAGIYILIFGLIGSIGAWTPGGLWPPSMLLRLFLFSWVGRAGFLNR